MEALLSSLPRLLRSGEVRPIIVGILVIVLCLLWMRSGRQQQQRQSGTSARAAAGGGSSGVSAAPATSISTRGVLIEFDAGQPRLLPNAAATLRRIAEHAEVYLVTTLPEDRDALEAETADVMARGGLFAEGCCVRTKAIFCSTEDGRAAIARQLSPAVHVDTSKTVLEYLAPHLQRVVYVQAAGAPPLATTASSVVLARSLNEYADMISNAAARSAA